MSDDIFAKAAKVHEAFLAEVGAMDRGLIRVLDEVQMASFVKAIMDAEPVLSERVATLLQSQTVSKPGSRVPGTTRFDKNDWYFHAYNNVSTSRWPSFLKRFARRIKQQNSKGARVWRRPFCKSNAKYQAEMARMMVEWDL